MTAQDSVGPVLVCSSSECVGFGCHGFTGTELTSVCPERDKSPTTGNEGAANTFNDSKFAEATESSPIIPTETIVPEVSRSSSELAAVSNADCLSSSEPPPEGVEKATNYRVIGNVIPVVEATDTPQATEKLEKKADLEGSQQDRETTQRSSSSADEPVNEGTQTPKVLSEGRSSPAPPTPIQGQIEMLLRDSDTRSSDTERTSDITSQSVSSAQTSNNSNLSTNSDVSNNSLCSQQNPPATTTSAATSAESAQTKKVSAGPEGYDEDPSALSALSHDTSATDSGSASPVQPSLSKKITWGKAKAYPGSETVSELEDERSVEASETRSMRRRQAAARMPVRHRTPSVSEPTRHFRSTRVKGKGLKRNAARKAPDREE